MPMPPKSLAVLAAMVGILAGLGGATAHKARAFSYMSSAPEVCVNCHIMEPQYEGWQKSSHHAVAACVDCHLPHDFVGKWTMKALNGWHHGSAFTLQDFHEPIMIKEMNAGILQQNCERCHEALVHDQYATRDLAKHGSGMQCTHCHQHVGHGQRAGLGGPLRADEIPAESPRPPAPAATTAGTPSTPR